MIDIDEIVTQRLDSDNLMTQRSILKLTLLNVDEWLVLRLNLGGQLINQPDTSTSARHTSTSTRFLQMYQCEHWIFERCTSTSTRF